MNEFATTQRLIRNAQFLGLRVRIEPEFGVFCQIAHGRRVRYVRNGLTDLNSARAYTLARRKDYTSWFLNGSGVRCVRTLAKWYTHDWAMSIKSPARSVRRVRGQAEGFEYPMTVKPNDALQGDGVSVAQSPESLEASVERALLCDRVALLQPLAWTYWNRSEATVLEVNASTSLEHFAAISADANDQVDRVSRLLLMKAFERRIDE